MAVVSINHMHSIYGTIEECEVDARHRAIPTPAQLDRHVGSIYDYSNLQNTYSTKALSMKSLCELDQVVGVVPVRL